MISYVVASHRPEVLAGNLVATLELRDGDELVVVQDPPSIATAYHEGQSRAVNPVRCYVHSDVRIVDPVGLRAALLEHCRPDVGMVGVVGSREPLVPWWDGTCCGSVVDARMGRLDFGPGGACAILDGLLLATTQTLTWDEAYPGFHLYDHDICRQQLARGLPNWCLTGGAELVVHNTTGPADTGRLNGWREGVARYRGKWGAG